MGFLSSVISVIQKKYDVGETTHNNVFYKIVASESINGKERYKIQCINTNAIFQMGICEIINDMEILQHLHPVQACYVGIEYAKNPFPITEDIFLKNIKKGGSLHERSTFHLKHQDREGKICFIDRRSDQEFLMDPKDIALSKELIEKFSSKQAFRIGIMAGQKIQNPVKISQYKKPFLQLVK